MPHYDRQETRSPASRENALFRDLRAICSMAKSRAPALRAQLKNIPIDQLKSRHDLSAVPLLRRSDLAALQAQYPPLGGTNIARLHLLKNLYYSRDGICADGHAKDWWGSARALYAAGFRKGDLIVNRGSYHLAPEAHIFDYGAMALGAVVIPAGRDNLDSLVTLLKTCPATGYFGDFSSLQELIRQYSGITRAFITGATLEPAQRKLLESQGIQVSQAYLIPEIGLVGYESGTSQTYIVNEGLIVEIVDPLTGKPLENGESGEIVVTRLKTDLPLLRFATGDLGTIRSGPQACGRTNLCLHNVQIGAAELAQATPKRSRS